MKAIIYAPSGSPDVLACVDVPKPIPADDEVLLRIRAASVNPADWRIALATPLLRSLLLSANKGKGKPVGVDVAGVVESIGSKVSHFHAGEEVFGVCRGAYAEYACGSESRLALKPANISFEQASAVPVAAVTALQGLRDKGRLQPGQKLLINGAAGGVGTFAVQVGKHLGAHVTGVCSTGNVELVRALGADRVIDYTRDDFTKETQRYDVMLDNVGNHSLSACRRVLLPKGRLVLAGGPKNAWAILARMLKAFALSRLMPERIFLFMARITPDDLNHLAELIRAGKVTPIIDRAFPLAEVEQAMRYCETGHARAKVVISIGA